MARFLYRSIDQGGQKAEGILSEPTRELALDRLHRMGHVPIELTQKAEGLWAKLNQQVDPFDRIDGKATAFLTRQLASLLAAGLTLERSLTVLEETTVSKSQRQMIGRLVGSLRRGSAFADALAAEDGVFPLHHISMVRAGEAAGTLPETLDSLARAQERTLAFAQSVKSALIYPTILLVLVTCTLVLVVTVVLPEFAPLFEEAGRSLPLATQIVLAIGTAVNDFWWALALAPAVLWLAGRQALRRPRTAARLHRFMLGTKRAGRWLITADLVRFFRTTGSLLENGQSLTSALGFGQSVVGNLALKDDLQKISARVRRGGYLAPQFAGLAYLPPVVNQLTRVGEETGALGAMMLQTADLLEDGFQSSLQRFLAVFAPLLTLIMGALVAAVIGSVLIGMMSINELVI